MGVILWWIVWQLYRRDKQHGYFLLSSAVYARQWRHDRFNKLNGRCKHVSKERKQFSLFYLIPFQPGILTVRQARFSLTNRLIKRNEVSFDMHNTNRAIQSDCRKREEVELVFSHVSLALSTDPKSLSSSLLWLQPKWE